jgi:hypothetical protein
MKKNDFHQMLDYMSKSWKKRDYEKVIQYFNEDLFYSDGLNYSFSNKSDLLEFFENDDGLEQFCVFYNSIFDERNQIGVGEYTYIGTNSYHGTVWIKIENNKISNWREYQHKTDKRWKEFWKNKE